MAQSRRCGETGNCTRRGLPAARFPELARGGGRARRRNAGFAASGASLRAAGWCHVTCGKARWTMVRGPGGNADAGQAILPDHGLTPSGRPRSLVKIDYLSRRVCVFRPAGGISVGTPIALMGWSVNLELIEISQAGSEPRARRANKLFAPGAALNHACAAAACSSVSCSEARPRNSLTDSR